MDVGKIRIEMEWRGKESENRDRERSGERVMEDRGQEQDRRSDKGMEDGR